MNGEGPERLLEDLMAIPGESGGEGERIERAAAEMKAIGYDEVFVDGFGNLIGIVGRRGSRGGRILAIDSHIDTVPPEEGMRVEVTGGTIRGRGACDNLGGLAAAIYAGGKIRRRGVPEEATLIIVASVSEEEAEGASWRWIIEEEGIRPDAVVVTEPSGNRLMFGQRGRAEIDIVIEGRSAHGAMPERGRNPIPAAARVVSRLDLLGERIAAGGSPAAKGGGLLGPASLAVTGIRESGPSRCSVPSSVRITIDRRLTSGETKESVLEEIRSAVEREMTGSDLGWSLFIPDHISTTWKETKFRTTGFYPGWILGDDEPLYAAAIAAYEKSTGKKAIPGAYRFSTNAAVISGEYGIPSVGLGPGLENLSHSGGEKTEVYDLVSASEFYSAIFLEL